MQLDSLCLRDFFGVLEPTYEAKPDQQNTNTDSSHPWIANTSPSQSFRFTLCFFLSWLLGSWSLHDPLKMGSLPKIKGPWTQFYFGSWRLQVLVYHSKRADRCLDPPRRARRARWARRARRAPPGLGPGLLPSKGLLKLASLGRSFFFHFERGQPTLAPSLSCSHGNPRRITWRRLHFGALL